MAETTVLKSSAATKNASPMSADPKAVLSGPHPVVNVTMGSGGKPSLGSAQSPHRKVEILDKPAMGLRGQGPGTAAIAARAEQVAQQRASSGGGPVVGTVVPVQIPVRAQGPNAPIAIAPSVIANAPTSPITIDQLMLCRHLVDQHLKVIPNEHPDAGLAATALAALDAALQVKAKAPAAPAAVIDSQPQVQAGTPPRTVVVTSARSAAPPIGGAPRRFQKPQVGPTIPAPAADRPPIDAAFDDGATTTDESPSAQS